VAAADNGNPGAANSGTDPGAAGRYNRPATPSERGARVPKYAVIVLWGCAAAVAVAARGPAFASRFHPPPGVFPDFVQEWVSARNFWAGEPVYQPQRAAVLRHTGYDFPEFDEMMRLNAHPPVAVLAALPFGLIPHYPAAHLAWSLCTFALFLLSVWVVLRELRVEPRWWHAPAAVALVVAADPVHSQLFQGQLNFLIAPLIAAGWAADRRGYQALAGAAVGAAAALKLFPGLLVLYFLAARRWRAAAVAVAVAAGLNLVALAAFGAGAFETYLREVLPSLDVFRTAWSNVSAPGYWRRVGRSLDLPWLGPAAGGLCQLAVAATVARAAWRSTTTAGRDRAYALAVVGMLVASPVAWGHYFVLLTLPLLLLWCRLPAGPWRALLAVLTAAFFLPVRTFANLAMGPAAAAQLQNHLPPPDDLWLSLGAFGAFPYLLAALFVVAAVAPLRPAEPDGPAVTSVSSAAA
jgi:hypothetical protein